MTKEEYKCKLEDLQKQIEELKKVKIEEENKVWEPKRGEKYYLIYPNGCVYSEIWAGNKCDKNCYMLDNCFRTKEDAEFELQKRIIRTRFKRYLKKHNDKINSNNSWYSLEFDFIERDVNIECNSINMSNEYISSSVEIMRDAIKFIGGEKVVKKYLFDYTGE